MAVYTSLFFLDYQVRRSGVFLLTQIKRRGKMGGKVLAVLAVLVILLASAVSAQEPFEGINFNHLDSLSLRPIDKATCLDLIDFTLNYDEWSSMERLIISKNAVLDFDSCAGVDITSGEIIVIPSKEDLFFLTIIATAEVNQIILAEINLLDTGTEINLTVSDQLAIILSSFIDTNDLFSIERISDEFSRIKLVIPINLIEISQIPILACLETLFVSIAAIAIAIMALYTGSYVFFLTMIVTSISGFFLTFVCFLLSPNMLPIIAEAIGFSIDISANSTCYVLGIITVVFYSLYLLLQSIPFVWLPFFFIFVFVGAAAALCFM